MSSTIFYYNNKAIFLSQTCSRLLKRKLNRASQEVKYQELYNRIGPADEVTNLRPIKYAESNIETPLEAKLRQKRKEVQIWNDGFWRKHNTDFVTERSEFKKEKQNKLGLSSLNAEQMSEFYKNFLDKNWKSHLAYNFGWYRKNIEVTFLDLQVRMYKIMKKAGS